MSSEASDWAWRLALPPADKLVILAMADGAACDGTHGGDAKQISGMTSLPRLIVLDAIEGLKSRGLLAPDRGRLRLVMECSA